MEVERSTAGDRARRPPFRREPKAESRAPRAPSLALRLKPLVFLVALVPLAVLVLRAWPLFAGRESSALGADPIRATEIYTGLWTLRFLAIALAVTPLRQLTGWGWLARYRRMLGLFAFFHACVHLSVWFGLDWFFDWPAMWEEIVKHKYILVGMLTFVLMLPLALTSTNGWVRRLGGARWARLHRLVYACAITGTVHYLWAVKKDTLFPLVYLLVFALLLGYRVYTRLATRGARARSRRGPRTQTPVVAVPPAPAPAPAHSSGD